MVKQTQTMTTSEWEIMRVIWTLGEATSRQVIRVMVQKTDWSPSTIKTLITRLQAKGYLTDNGASRDRLYLPTVAEHEAMTATLSRTFHAMCAMCVGQALVDVLATTPLSKHDITQLQDTLQTKYTQAPDRIACDCMPHQQEEIAHHDK